VLDFLRVPGPGEVRGGEDERGARLEAPRTQADPKEPTIRLPHPDVLGAVLHQLIQLAAPPDIALDRPAGKVVVYTVVPWQSLVDDLTRVRPQLLDTEDVGVAKGEERSEGGLALGPEGVAPDVVGHHD